MAKRELFFLQTSLIVLFFHWKERALWICVKGALDYVIFFKFNLHHFVCAIAVSREGIQHCKNVQKRILFY